MLQHLDNTNFDATIKNNDVVLVDFFADWCGPCKALHPSLEKLALGVNSRTVIAKVNVDQNPELAQRFGIRSIPALYYFQKGELKMKHVGLQSETDMLNIVNELATKA
jgi:thioredoxin 1